MPYNFFVQVIYVHLLRPGKTHTEHDTNKECNLPEAQRNCGQTQKIEAYEDKRNKEEQLGGM